MEQMNYSIQSSGAVAEILESRPAPRLMYQPVKRLGDVVLGLVAGAIVLPLVPLLALAIKLDSPGPVIYRQERLGKDGKHFTLYKFRSMCIDAEKNGAVWAQRDDPRVTRIGRVMRKLRIDELPQVVNIVRGEMSIVGPRPEREVFYREFSAELPLFRERLRVTPGLTGWAQVNGGYELRPDQKLTLDLEYIRRQSLRFDALCVWKTVRVLLHKEGAR